MPTLRQHKKAPLFNGTHVGYGTHLEGTTCGKWRCDGYRCCWWQAGLRLHQACTIVWMRTWAVDCPPDGVRIFCIVSSHCVQNAVIFNPVSSAPLIAM